MNMTQTQIKTLKPGDQILLNVSKRCRAGQRGGPIPSGTVIAVYADYVSVDCGLKGKWPDGSIRPASIRVTADEILGTVSN